MGLGFSEPCPSLGERLQLEAQNCLNAFLSLQQSSVFLASSVLDRPLREVIHENPAIKIMSNYRFPL